MNDRNDFALVPKPPGSLEKTESGAKRILASIVADALALAHANVLAQSLSALQPGAGAGAGAAAEKWYQEGQTYLDRKSVV